MIRLPQRETRTLLAVHGWSAVLLGLLLYAVIVTGVASVFTDEIADWSSPLPSQADTAWPQGIGSAIQDAAQTVDPQFHEEMIAFRQAGGRMQVFFHKHDTDDAGKPIERGVVTVIDPQSRQIIERHVGTDEEIGEMNLPNALAHFMVDLHVRLHLPNPWGLLLSGILGLAMMLAAVTGFVIHRHLFKELFTLRRHKDRMLSTRDAHVIAGTWNLPFAFILAFTGSFFSFASSFGIPAMAMAAFGGDRDKVIEVLVGNPATNDPTPAPPPALDRALDDARQRAGSDPWYILSEHWGRADALQTVVMLPASGTLRNRTFLYDAAGRFMQEKPLLGSVPSSGAAVYSLMGPLHFGNFAGVLSKAAWFALGFAGAYVTFTGLLLWTTRREDQPAWRYLGRSVTGLGYGLPLALIMAAYGYFPVVRLGGDVHITMMTAFLVALLGALLLANLLRQLADSRRILLSLTALALIGLPWLRWIGTGVSWIDAAHGGMNAVFAIDLGLSIAGLLCLRAVRRPSPAMKRLPSAQASPAT